MKEKEMPIELDEQTLQWVLDRIEGVANIEYYEYSSALEHVKSDVESAIKILRAQKKGVLENA